MASAHLGGIAGGAILGSSTGFTYTLANNLISGTINQDYSLNSLFVEPFIGAATGALIGGIAGGVDAYSKGKTLWKGRGKELENVFLTDGGGVSTNSRTSADGTITQRNPENLHTFEINQRNNEVSTTVPGLPSSRTINAVNGGFEGGYTVNVRGPLSGTEVYSFSVDGQIAFRTDRGTNSIFRVGPGKHIFTFGIAGQSGAIQQTGTTTVTANFSTRINTNWRSWDGLFWFK